MSQWFSKTRVKFKMAKWIVFIALCCGTYLGHAQWRSSSSSSSKTSSKISSSDLDLFQSSSSDSSSSQTSEDSEDGDELYEDSEDEGPELYKYQGADWVHDRCDKGLAEYASHCGQSPINIAPSNIQQGDPKDVVRKSAKFFSQK